MKPNKGRCYCHFVSLLPFTHCGNRCNILALFPWCTKHMCAISSQSWMDCLVPVAQDDLPFAWFGASLSNLGGLKILLSPSWGLFVCGFYLFFGPLTLKSARPNWNHAAPAEQIKRNQVSLGKNLQHYIAFHDLKRQPWPSLKGKVGTHIILVCAGNCVFCTQNKQGPWRQLPSSWVACCRLLANAWVQLPHSNGTGLHVR